MVSSREQQSPGSRSSGCVLICGEGPLVFGSNPQFWAHKIASAWELASGLLGGVAVVVKSCLVLLWRQLHFRSCWYKFLCSLLVA